MSFRLTVLAVDHPHHLPVAPEVVGLAIFVLFCILMMALLMFGKGRPHA